MRTQVKTSWRQGLVTMRQSRGVTSKAILKVVPSSSPPPSTWSKPLQISLSKALRGSVQPLECETIIQIVQQDFSVTMTSSQWDLPSSRVRKTRRSFPKRPGRSTWRLTALKVSSMLTERDQQLKRTTSRRQAVSQTSKSRSTISTLRTKLATTSQCPSISLQLLTL